MSPSPDFTQIVYEVSDHVATITLNRPDQLNAFTGVMMREMIAAFDLIDADDDVRVVIVTGAGRGFCAGADLSSGGETFSRGGSDEIPEDVGVPRDGGGLVSLRIFECKKPVIAAINGPAVGVGVTMTLPMDIRLASESARFGFVFARRGIVPEACSSWFLPRLVGISQAAEWCYSGRVFPAAEALAGGLVRSVHAPEDLLPTAQAIAAEIAENTAPVSVVCSTMASVSGDWRTTAVYASPSLSPLPACCTSSESSASKVSSCTSVSRCSAPRTSCVSIARRPSSTNRSSPTVLGPLRRARGAASPSRAASSTTFVACDSVAPLATSKTRTFAATPRSAPAPVTSTHRS